ncbi:UNVERIFIED_CONTAM: hypothetical protein PYX00_002717 [Menopon gallinae]|uniref:Androgen-induced 1 n=1 Tax=Menopon gallinae TaxID=328185 RepID=A0AAW2HXM1_9NEOP
MLRESVHLVAALQFLFAVYYDFSYVTIPPSVSNIGVSFGGKLKFLTNWDAIIQCIYFSISFANDIVGTNEFYAKQKPLIRTIKDNLFCCIAFPLATFVSLTFWGLYAIDRELVFPAAMDEYFPTWLNHVVHTNVLIFSVVEFVTTFREYPPRKHGLPALTLFMLVYLIWVFIIYLRSGSWVYPVMQVLNWPARIMFFLSMLFFILGIYISQEILNDKIWRQTIEICSQEKRSC